MEEHEPVTSGAQVFPGGLAGSCFDRLAAGGDSTATVIVGAMAGDASPATSAGDVNPVQPNNFELPPNDDASFEPFDFTGYGGASGDFGHFPSATYSLELPTSFLFDPRELPYAQGSLQPVGGVHARGTLQEQLLRDGSGDGGEEAYGVAQHGGKFVHRAHIGGDVFAAGHSFPPSATTLNPRFITLETPTPPPPPPPPTPAPPSTPESHPRSASPHTGTGATSAQEKFSGGTPPEDNASENTAVDQTGGKKWRPFSASQREKLESVYIRDQHPSKQVKELLSAQTGLTIKQVDGWFGRRRAKEDVAKSDSNKAQRTASPVVKASDEHTKQAEDTDGRPSESPIAEMNAPAPANDMALLMAELPKLVDEAGGLKDEQAVDSMKNLLVKDMKDITLGAKSVWLNAVKRTSKPAVLKKVAGLKVTSVIRNWLHAAVRENSALQLLLLEVIKHLPITVDVLQKTQLGKLVRKASSSEREDVKQKAEEVLAHLRRVVDEETRRREEEVRRTEERERLQEEKEMHERQENARLEAEQEKKRQELHQEEGRQQEIGTTAATVEEECKAREESEREQRLQELEMKRLKESEERLAREVEIVRRELKMEEERRETDRCKRSELVRRNSADESLSRKKSKPNESDGLVDLSDLEVAEPLASAGKVEDGNGSSSTSTSPGFTGSKLSSTSFMSIRRATEAEVAAAAAAVGVSLASSSNSPSVAGGRSILKRSAEGDAAAARARRLSGGVKFAPPQDLVTVHEIESINPMDIEDESAGVQERSERRSAFLKAMQMDTQWVLPKAIRLSEKSKNAVRVVETEEAKVQKQREGTTLMAVYVDRDSVPLSPSEAGVEVCDDLNPMMVPLVDLSKEAPTTMDVTPSTATVASPEIQQASTANPLGVLPGSLPTLSKSQTDKLADILKNLTNMGGAPPPSSSVSPSNVAKPVATPVHQPPPAPAPIAQPVLSSSASAEINDILSMLSNNAGPKPQPTASFGAAPSTAPPLQQTLPFAQPVAPAPQSVQPQTPMSTQRATASRQPGINSSMLNDILATINRLGKPVPQPQPVGPSPVPGYANSPYLPGHQPRFLPDTPGMAPRAIPPAGQPWPQIRPWPPYIPPSPPVAGPTRPPGHATGAGIGRGDRGRGERGRSGTVGRGGGGVARDLGRGRGAYRPG